MGRNRAAAMFIGVVVCAPLLFLYQSGIFIEAAQWLSKKLPLLLVLPEPDLPGSITLQYGYYTVMAFASAWVAVELASVWRKVAYLIGVAALTVSLTVLLAWNGLLFEPFSGILASTTAGVLGLMVSNSVSGNRRHIMRRYFVGRLSSQGFDELAARHDPARLTERREVTILTCRLTNHIELSSEIEPPAFEELIALFQKSVSEFLVSRGAYLEACNAQRVRVFFGYPLPSETHAVQASQVVLQLREHLKELQKEIHARWSWKPRFGCSLSTGKVACGLYGHEDFQLFSAVGEAVEFGDRLCSLNGVYGTQVLLSARTYALVKDLMEVRPMEMVYTQRLKQVSEVYELLGARGDLGEAELRSRDAFWQGVVQLRKGDVKQAAESFGKARREGHDDPALRYFLDLLDSTRKEEKAEADGKPVPKHARSLNAT